MQLCTRCLPAAVFGVAVATVMLFAGARSTTANNDEAAENCADTLPEPQTARFVAPQADDFIPVQVAWQNSASAEKSAKADALPDKGWVGLMLEDADGKGVRVTDVFPGGPAAFGGARVGDFIVKIGNSTPTDAAAAAQALEDLQPGEECKLTVRRGDSEIVLTITPRSLREFHGAYVSEMLQRDPRHPQYTERPGVSAADMNVELVRRLFEQNRRLEIAIQQVRQEVAELRKEIQK